MTGILQWLWEGTLIAGGVAVALALAPRLTARTRYSLWVLALLVTLCLPLARLVPIPLLPLPAPAESGALAAASRAIAAAIHPVAAGRADSGSALITVSSAPDWLLSCLVGIWLGSVAVAASRIGHSLATLRNLRASARPLPASLARALGERLTREGGRRVDIRVSSAITGACAVGIFRQPMVLLSERLIATLDPDDLELIVRHERAHLARFDDWAALLQACVLAVAGLHPAVRFMCARLDREREAACDDEVAVDTGDARRYATCLADAADAIAGARRRGLATVVPHVGTGSLRSRVHRLLDPRIARSPAPQWLALTAGGAGVLAAAVATAGISPIIIAADRPADRGADVMAFNPPSAGVAAWSPAAEVRLSPASPARPIDSATASPDSPDRPARAAKATVAPAAAPSLQQKAAAAAASKHEPASATIDDAGLRSAPTPAIAPDLPGPAHDPAPTELAPLAATPLPVPLSAPAADDPVVAGVALAGDAGVLVGRQIGRWGTAAGTVSREAGSAIGGYFTRAGKAVAARF